MLTHPFPLQPLLLLLLEVFLPLQALLLRLLPGFSLGLFFLKHTRNFNAGSRGSKNLAKITCLLRNKGGVTHCNYCLQPEKQISFFTLKPEGSILNIYSLVRNV